MIRLLRNLALAALALLAAGCDRMSAPVRVEDAWANATPAGATVAAVYMKVTTKDADTLLSATTTVADHIEMHTNSEQNGMMQMRPLSNVPLEAGEPFTFAPGGAHFMLVELRQPLTAGLRFPMTLQFQHAPPQTVQVRVVELGSR
ncbi:copper chaperone PCu(A)C [Peristeroidobacter agariperforans]|uniref:copper chaperone PCu(A)C n=1 Tax=Peristeroidobacter agariperforans TaxID=268404 RepID=UPI00101B7D20|nr:copper chaperone PCu(A)C [Peristeroidobacter agariperforans]